MRESIESEDAQDGEYPDIFPAEFQPTPNHPYFDLDPNLDLHTQAYTQELLYGNSADDDQANDDQDLEGAPKYPIDVVDIDGYATQDFHLSPTSSPADSDDQSQDSVETEKERAQQARDDSVLSTDELKQLLTPGKRGRPPGSRNRAKPATNVAKSTRVEKIPRGERPKGAPKGVKRGPRAPAQPSVEFREHQNQATEAYIAQNYDEAIYNAVEAIKLNPEYFSSHSILSLSYRKLGKNKEALDILWAGAHSSRAIDVWVELADATEELSTGDEKTIEENLLYCYSKVILLDKDNVNFRNKRLQIYLKRDNVGRALREAAQIHQIEPTNLENVQLFAELSLDMSDPNRAKAAYESTIRHLVKSNTTPRQGGFWFSDLNIYIEILSYLGEYQEGLRKMKWVARWLIGRRDESYWDRVVEDDREWDIDDEPRRASILEWQSSKYALEMYGAAIPIEVRAKMGVFRLRLGQLAEAQQHFEEVDKEFALKESISSGEMDIIREIGDAFLVCGYPLKALGYFESLEAAIDFEEEELLEKMARCYRATSQYRTAERLFGKLALSHPKSTRHLAEIARMYEAIGKKDKTVEYLTRIFQIGGRAAARRAGLQTSLQTDSNEEDDEQEEKEGHEQLIASPKPFKKRYLSLRYDVGQATRDISSLYVRALALRSTMREEDEVATREWINTASRMIIEFRCANVFFGRMHHVFFGYDHESKWMAFHADPEDPIPKIDYGVEMEEDDINSQKQWHDRKVPQHYRGIHFKDWLDIICEYALVCARQDLKDASYKALETAAKANVFNQYLPAIRIVYMCWCTCALLLGDDENLVESARWFIRSYPKSTSVYELYLAFARLYKGETTLFDDTATRRSLTHSIEQAEYDNADVEDESARPNSIENRSQSLQRAERPRIDDESGSYNYLLRLYGYIAMSSDSMRVATREFLRLIQSEPNSSHLNFCLAVSYLQYGLAGDSNVSREGSIMHSLAFLQEYERLRSMEIDPLVGVKVPNKILKLRKAEIEFNFGRFWHTISLMHLAVPAYERCLAVCEEIDRNDQLVDESDTEDMNLDEPDCRREAAYALQQIHAADQNWDMARAITEKYLVF